MTTLIQWDRQKDVAISKFREPGIAIRCLIPWRFLFIQEHTKKVFGCPYHTRPYGDLTTHSLEEIWNGENAQEMRGSLLKHEIPRYCLNNAAACPLIFEEQMSGKAIIENYYEMGVNDHWCLGQGWFRPEKIPFLARWTGPRADIRIRVRGKRSISFEIASCKPDVDKEPAVGSILIDDQRVGSFRLSTKYDCKIFTFRLPPMTKDIAKVTIITENPFTPADLLSNGDTRKLGIIVRRIETRRLPPALLRFGQTAAGGRLLKAAVRVEHAFSHRIQQARNFFRLSRAVASRAG